MPLQRLHRTENASKLGGFLRWTSMTLFCGGVLLGTAWRKAAAQTLMVSDASDSGPNTLALRLASVNAGTGGDTINFVSLVAGSNKISLSSGQLTIMKSVSITGPGAANLIIDSNHSSRVVYVNAGTGNAVTLSGLAIYHGQLSAAGVNAGAGILNKSGNLYLDGVAVYDCYINTPATTAIGGGVASYQPLTLRNGCNIHHNGAQGTLVGKGGGVYCKALLTIQNSSIYRNNLNWWAAVCAASRRHGAGIYSYNTKYPEQQASMIISPRCRPTWAHRRPSVAHFST